MPRGKLPPFKFDPNNPQPNLLSQPSGIAPFQPPQPLDFTRPESMPEPSLGSRIWGGMNRPLLPEIEMDTEGSKFKEGLNYLYNDIIRESTSPLMLGAGLATGGLGGLSIKGGMKLAPTAVRGGLTLAKAGTAGAAGASGYKAIKEKDPKAAVDAALMGAGYRGFSKLQNKLITKKVDELAKGGGSISERVEAGYQLGNAEVNDAIRKSGFGKNLRDLRRNFTISGTRQLDQMGVKGQKIKRKLQRVVQDRRQISANYSRQANAILKGVDEKEMPAIVSLIESGKMSGKGKLAQKARELDDLFQRLGREAETGGVEVLRKGKYAPFKSRKNYFPHKIDNNKDVEGLLAKKFGSRGAKVLEKIRAQRDPQDSLLFERSLRDIPFLKKDKSVVLDHIEDMAEHIARAKNIGSNALSRRDSELSSLIDSLGPTLSTEAREIAEGQLSRSTDKFGISGAVRWVTNFESATKLGYHVISNMAGNLPTVLHTENRAFVSALKNLASGRATQVSREAGALSDVADTMLTDARSGKLSRILGLNWAEDVNRKISGSVGIANAEVHLKRLIKDPTDLLTRRKLQDLILTEDLDKVIRRGSLTDDELKYAAGRMGEITQGLGESMNLPNAWTGDVYKNLATMFMKYAFQGGRSINAAIRSNPERNIPAALTLGLIFGEVTGDQKAVVTGVIRGAAGTESVPEGIQKELQYRSEWPGYMTGSDSEAINRVVANTFDGWLLGIGFEIISKILGGQGRAEKSFPVASDLFDIGGAVGKGLTGDFKPLGKAATERIPFLGRGLQRAWFPNENQEI